MPSVKIPRKSTDTDMTPFVDVAFLILSFFMLATKFKPPEPVEITTPNSVSTVKIGEHDAILVAMDPKGRVFFDFQPKDAPGEHKKYDLIKNLNSTRNLGLTEAEMQKFALPGPIGVPFANLKQVLSGQAANAATWPGIPVKDSANNELQYWIRDAVSLVSGRTVDYMIKGDNGSKYPDFKHVLEAFKRNEIYKFKLVTMPEEAPAGSPLATERATGKTE
ncbi:ExbD/TolR family protein [Flaviaesturariibacter aridisoli]|uniref:Biopolymer transporter ExbD n=1 Tax=Flaviaesturariibacter aridisoli TaxID=2545761 RepID=A0A4R4E2G9_9BACT|nr:biopolymer transporter ExbD [Flaviaesturariibacter aridisoli]TCZ73714.1 biopolymer transporter ExbD [Flaviaesturariibacter aridisoli]